MAGLLTIPASNAEKNVGQIPTGSPLGYRNVPHDSTGEKPSSFLYEVDCRTETEAAQQLVVEPTEVSDYREELILSLSAGWKQATQAIRNAQLRYKLP